MTYGHPHPLTFSPTILDGLQPSSHMPNSGNLAEVEELYMLVTTKPKGGWVGPHSTILDDLRPSVSCYSPSLQFLMLYEHLHYCLLYNSWCSRNIHTIAVNEKSRHRTGFINLFVGRTGIEPVTSCLSSKRSKPTELTSRFASEPPAALN